MKQLCDGVRGCRTDRADAERGVTEAAVSPSAGAMAGGLRALLQASKKHALSWGLSVPSV